MAKKRKGIAKPRHQPFLEEYSFEIKVVILLALGIFLLVEELEIKQYIWNFIALIFFSIGSLLAHVGFSEESGKAFLTFDSEILYSGIPMLPVLTMLFVMLTRLRLKILSFEQ